MHGRHTVLGILKLCRNPEGGTAYELIMLNVHDTARDVAINNVEGEVESFGTETKGEMDLDEKVDEAGTHVPPNFRLLVHGTGRGHGALLNGGDE